ncbi:nudix hydrolase 15, mitochondrial-like isoform X2 [Nymphaea colorata]|nr:nudix hydrolase 15, mitochondrial-like isoform X2 [Nymphaea colorata]
MAASSFGYPARVYLIDKGIRESPLGCGLCSYRRLTAQNPSNGNGDPEAMAGIEEGEEMTVGRLPWQMHSIGTSPESSSKNSNNNTSLLKKRAAVLVLVFEDDAGDLRVILTKRSSNLSSHSGEVSLPGGKAEEGDADDTETALREAKEEIGLDPSLVTVSAILEPFLSKHMITVIPVIGRLSHVDSLKLSANRTEVDAIFDVPLEMFLKDENRRWEEKEWMGTKIKIHYFNFKSEQGEFIVWGLTARILIQVASFVFKRHPGFRL